ncbi:NAD-dependent epimerase/dehydratase family protein [Kitasatospora sp. NPDC001175]|uniref:NAD-dependent epimerase/dehydratase family protein n=1 Tax=Kitasatospora sp. NPDC001175 TaxID=3157103 RepID=UPI003CFF3CE4
MTRRPGAAAPPLVTVLGASGFVGSAVTAAFADRPVRLRAVARRPSTVPAGSAQVESVTADLTNNQDLAEAVDGSDAVLCLVMHSGGWRAAVDDGPEAVNVGVMRELVQVLRSAERPPLVLYSGAASQVGVPPAEPIDGSEPDHPATEYDRQKLAAESLLLDATAAGLLQGVSLRLPTVFGPATAPGAEDRGVVSFMARRALAGEPLTLWHDGTVRRDLVHVHDIARAFLAAYDHPGRLVGGHWLLGSGQGTPLGEVFRTLARLAAEHTGRPPVPVCSVEPPAHAPLTDFAGVTIDSSAFRAATGWAPEVPLEEALRHTVAALADRAARS